FGADGPSNSEGPVQCEALLAMEDSRPGDCHWLLSDPERWPTKYNAHAWNDELIVALIDISQFVLVDRVVSNAEADCVQGTIPPIVRLMDWLKAACDDLIKIHPFALSHPLLNFPDIVVVRTNSENCSPPNPAGYMMPQRLHPIWVCVEY